MKKKQNKTKTKRQKSCKHFNSYLYNDHKVNPLHIMLPKTNDYVKSYDGKIKWIYFLIEDDDLLEIYNAIWYKVNTDMIKEFDSEPFYK